MADDYQDVINRVEELEVQQDIQAAQLKELNEIKAQLQELVDLVKTAKAGANIILVLLNIAKWVGIVAAAVTAFWILLTAIKTGQTPGQPLTKIPD